jgi:hypothetical protein
VRSNALPAFERSPGLTWVCVRTQVNLFVVERRVQVRPQITAAAARANMGVRLTAEHLRSNAYNC